MNTTKTILVADDDPAITQVIQTALSHTIKCVVITVQDGEEAWRAAQENDIDLIISDWNMPIKTGVQLLEDVRNDDRLKRTPFLMLTSRSDKDSVMGAISAGVTQYIHKPFDHPALIAKVSQILALELPKPVDEPLGLPDDDNLLEG